MMLKQPNAAPLAQSLRLLTVTGCLSTVYACCISNPVATEFFRQLGATDFDFGLLSGLPMLTLFMQFVGAYLTDRLRQRKPGFIAIEIVARLLWLPIATLPLLFPHAPPHALIAPTIALFVLNGLLSNMTSPLWYSWMSDLIPRRILNRFWGVRQRYTTLVWAASFVAVAGFAFWARDWPARVSFPILVGIGVLASLADILLFLWVDEPRNLRNLDSHPLAVLLAPLRHREYRSMVVFTCAWSVASIVAGAFMQVYILKVLQVAVWKATLMWCSMGIGGAIVGPLWGRLADRHGHRPVLLVCMLFKPLIALAFLLATPGNAIPLLTVALFFDSMLNGGYSIATNGFMLKLAPRVSRSMFIAAVTALSGLACGLGAVLAGLLLKQTEGLRLALFGSTWGNYHLAFALSFVLRALCIPLAAAVREPDSSHTRLVINQLLQLWPFQILTIPVGLYRRFLSAEEEEDEERGDSSGLS